MLVIGTCNVLDLLNYPDAGNRIFRVGHRLVHSPVGQHSDERLMFGQACARDGTVVVPVARTSSCGGESPPLGFFLPEAGEERR